MHQFVFLGPCDRLRMSGNEQQWQKMMQLRVPISIDDFAEDCALETLLEDGETLEDFTCSDPDSGFYSSVWGDQPCRFIQTCGFEFIFILPAVARYRY